MNNCAIGIPIYKKTFTDLELFNVKTSLSNLVGFDIYLYSPESLDVSYYKAELGDISFIEFDAKFFRSISDYSRLMLSKEFYQAFNRYSHILICQPDALVLKPELEYWIKQPFDYLGAPWPNGFECKIKIESFNIEDGILCRAFVGNGGLSLRKIDACLSLFDEFPSVWENWKISGNAEDLFFGLLGNISNNFLLPNLMVAARFSHETQPEYLYKLTNENIPFGCHAYEKYSTSHWKNLLSSLSLKPPLPF